MNHQFAIPSRNISIWSLAPALFIASIMSWFQSDNRISFALFPGVVTVLFGYHAFIKPPVSKLFVEFIGDEMRVHNPFVLPTSTDRISLKNVTSLEIVGPSGGRYIRCFFADGSVRDLGPYRLETSLEDQLVDWLKHELPQTIHVSAHEPASYFETVRANY